MNRLNQMPQAHQDFAFAQWREQIAAQFGRRAYVRLGRGFVIFDAKDTLIYVTRLDDAPRELVTEVNTYAPYAEALVVHEDPEQPGVLIVRRIRIDTDQ